MHVTNSIYRAGEIIPDTMRTLFYYVTDTLSDWECGNVLAELCSGRYLKDPSLRYDLILCGRTMQPVRSMGGIRLEPETCIADILPGKDDLLLLPGADTWFDPDQGVVDEKVREVLETGTVVGAICGATMALARAGLLDGRAHTSNDIAALKMFCPAYRGEAFYVQEPAVTDGNLVTASGLAPIDFAHHIFRRLDVMRPATLEAWYGLFQTRKAEYFYALLESLPGKNDNP